MKDETKTPTVYRAAEHGELPVSQDSYDRFVSLLPVEARDMFTLDAPSSVLSDVVYLISDHMLGYMHECQTRPALPHEREDGGNCRFLTKKGAMKWDERLRAFAAAFAEAFGLSPTRPGAKTPREGPLDPLIYD